MREGRLLDNEYSEKNRNMFSQYIVSVISSIQIADKYGLIISDGFAPSDVSRMISSTQTIDQTAIRDVSLEHSAIVPNLQVVIDYY